MHSEFLVVGLVILLILILGTIWGCRDYFSSQPSSGRAIKRPNHPQWYTDIPETHPEVLELAKMTEAQSRETPKFTSVGYAKRKMPKELHEYLLGLVRTTDRIPEDRINIHRRTSSGPPPYLVPIPSDRKEWIFGILKPILEEWSGVSNLVPTSAYGPREYRRGSSLRMHCDTGNTHIISAILHIDREGMDEDWPLVVINRKGERENIYMEPGDMVLYESASLPHSRELPLKGDYYTNMFIHFAPHDFGT